MIQPRCCGRLGCGYVTRQPQASRPVPPPPRFLTLISRLLAGAGVLGCVAIAVLALR